MPLTLQKNSGVFTSGKGTSSRGYGRTHDSYQAMPSGQASRKCCEINRAFQALWRPIQLFRNCLTTQDLLATSARGSSATPKSPPPTTHLRVSAPKPGCPISRFHCEKACPEPVEGSGLSPPHPKHSPRLISLHPDGTHLSFRPNSLVIPTEREESAFLAAAQAPPTPTSMSAMACGC
jgi:hypothetical protein